MRFADEYFNRDIAQHEMQVIRDDGVNRHIRFKRPGTMCMHFDLLTWPGYLCYTGDMGTYVFSRLEDMFEFFRRREIREPYQIDMRYWAEKLQASDRSGSREWSADKFKADVLDYFKQRTDECTQARRSELWEEIESQVFDRADEGEHFAWAALRDFDHEGFQFTDWERESKVWTHRFQWCCHALEWAIDTYDASKVEVAAVAA